MEIIKYDIRDKMELIFNYTLCTFLPFNHVYHKYNNQYWIYILIRELYRTISIIFEVNMIAFEIREFEITRQITLGEKLVLNYVSFELYEIFKNTSLV